MNSHIARQAGKRAYLTLRGLLLDLIIRKPPPAARPGSDSILIISQRRLGDISLEIPAIREFRKAGPEARIGIVAPEIFHPLLEVTCSPHRLFRYPAGWADARALASELRGDTWDQAIDLTMDYHLLPAWLARGSGAAITAGFAGAGRERFFNRVLPAHKAHMLDRFRRALGVSGAAGEFPIRLDLNIDAPPMPDRSGGRRVIGLHPGATHPTQRWPEEHFAQLASMIAAAGHACLVLGVRSESGLIHRIVKLAGEAAVPLITEGNILEFAAALQKLDVIVCNNSGPMHLAALLGTPSVSVMGPTDLELWAPVGSGDIYLRRDDLSCIGCNLGYCKIKTHECMRRITPDMVFAAVTRSLDALRKRH